MSMYQQMAQLYNFVLHGLANVNASANLSPAKQPLPFSATSVFQSLTKAVAQTLLELSSNPAQNYD